MRILTYKLEMCGRGYVVASGEVQGYDLWNGRECQSIKFFIMDCQEDLDASIIKDGWNTESNPTKKYSYENYQKILRSEDDDWYLYSFEVSPGCLILDFYNSQSDCPCCLIIEGIYTLKVQFNVPKQNGELESYYEVEISNILEPSESAVMLKTSRVTECFRDVRRILEFKGRSDDSIDKEEYVFVIEYADL